MTTTALAPSKSQQLRDWMQSKGFFSTHEVIAFGLSLHWTRAQREKGQLHHDGVIRELTREEKMLRGMSVTEGAYEWVGKSMVEMMAL